MLMPDETGIVDKIPAHVKYRAGYAMVIWLIDPWHCSVASAAVVRSCDYQSMSVSGVPSACFLTILFEPVAMTCINDHGPFHQMATAGNGSKVLACQKVTQIR